MNFRCKASEEDKVIYHLYQGNYMKVLIVDPQNAGICGDMFVGALLDLGASFEEIEMALNSISEFLGDFKVSSEKTKKSGISATAFSFTFNDREIAYFDAKGAIEGADISSKAKEFALNCLETLVEAESRVHGLVKEEIKLHEASDSIADFVASAVALDDLALWDAKILSTPINTGKGFFEFHGKRQIIPSPATLEILKGKPIFGDIEFELTTPTGASILVSLVDDFIEESPLMKVEGIGYGAGKKELEVPNVFRVTLGEELDYGLIPERISVLETNIDDVSGEILGYTLEKLVAEGAKDANISPCLMKKNRPGHLLRVICAQEDVKRLVKLIMEETGTLGVRVLPITHRYVLEREVIEKTISIGGKDYIAKFKVATDSSGNVVVISPEFEDLGEIAEKTGLSILKVKAIFDSKIKELLKM